MSKGRSNKKFLLGIAVAVLLPLFFYFVTSLLSKGKVKIPGFYVVERVDNAGGKKDTTYHRAADLVLTNQLGQQVSLNNDLKGKIIIVDFIYASCTGTCPQLSKNMWMLQTSFRKDPKKEASLDTIVQFVSITVDPEHDSFPVLRTYAETYGANHDHWWFLTGNKKSIYDFARNELHLPVGPGDGGSEDFLHSGQFVLLDRERYIRGYYNGTNDTDVRKCADDIVLLTLEKKKK